MIHVNYESNNHNYKPAKCRFTREARPESFQNFIHEVKHSSCQLLQIVLSFSYSCLSFSRYIQCWNFAYIWIHGVAVRTRVFLRIPLTSSIHWLWRKSMFADRSIRKRLTLFDRSQLTFICRGTPPFCWRTHKVSFWKKSSNTDKYLSLCEGLSFSEKYAGTNAISLALQQREPIWTKPKQNYSNILSRFAMYAIPPSDSFPMSIAVITTDRQSPDWLTAMLRLVAYSIILITQYESSVFSQSEKVSVALTNRQKMVLLRMARGLTDQAIAVELHIKLNTVRFHKKELYQRMNTNNAVTTVIQALKDGLLLLEEI